MEDFTRPQSANAQPSEKAPALDLAKSLDFNADKMLQDIADMVICYCAKGFDAFDEQLLKSEAFNKEQIQEALQIYGLVLEQLQKGLAEFSEQARLTTLRVPKLVHSAAVTETSRPVQDGEEQKLNQALEQIRQEIREAQVSTRRYKLESEVFKQELQLAGNPEQFSNLTQALASGKDNLSQDVASIASCAEALQPALKNAEAILSRHVKQKAGRLQNNAALLEKEVAARKAASKGFTTNDLSQLREILSAGDM